jgi:AcrR family transcriptional regulator
MSTTTHDNWIKAGYETFARTGQSGLKIEPLAKKVGISKSSFYHHFADLEVFMKCLLDHHLSQSYIIADKEQKANTIDPELIQVLVEHKIDLLFNRQLRIHKNVQAFEQTLVQSSKIVGDAFKMAWVRDLNLHLTQAQTEGLFTLALENFYLQINEDNLNNKWLSEYFYSLKKTASKFS